MKINILIELPLSIFYHIKLLILSFEEFNNKFGIDSKAMSNIRVEDIGKKISLTPIEIIMKDQKPVSVANPVLNVIVNLHPTDGKHQVWNIRREGSLVYYFDSFGVVTPTFFLEELVDLGSNERIKEYDESFCGAYCLYLIYLNDKGLRIKDALNILVNQFKNPGMYDECCKDNDIDSEDEIEIYLLIEKPPLVKPRSRISPLLMAGYDQRSISGTAWGTKGGAHSQIVVNGSLQSWLVDDNNIVLPHSPKATDFVWVFVCARVWGLNRWMRNDLVSCIFCGLYSSLGSFAGDSVWRGCRISKVALFFQSVVWVAEVVMFFCFVLCSWLRSSWIC